MSLHKIIRFRLRQQLSHSRCLFLFLAMSIPVYLFSLHAAINLRLFSVAVSTHTSASNGVLQLPAMPKRPDVPMYAIGPLFSSCHPVLSALYSHGFGIRFVLVAACSSFDLAPLPTNVLITKRCLSSLPPDYLESTVVEAIRLSCLSRCSR